ncbi:MAG: cysteine desulfurase [Blautia sp.]|nr:cysteine desulfurase [Blautia sp.]
MEAYFDNSATTRCCPEAAEFVNRALTCDFGNPSSLHKKGIEAERYVLDAQETLAGYMKVRKKEILFTSGGTESDNLAVIGSAMAYARQGKHIITSQAEHPAVTEPMKFLEKQGFEVTYLPVDERGALNVEQVRQCLREDTILVSIMYVNNEVGSVFPISEIGKTVHEGSRALFHVDAVQAFGKYRILPRQQGIDLMSVSGHKLHGPKGIGFLYVKEGVRLIPQILGGGQQMGLRSGTDNVPGIAGLAAAVRARGMKVEETADRLRELKKRLADGLLSMDGLVLNGPPIEEGAPHILNVSFTGVRSEVMLHALEERGIYVSAGSACSSHKKKREGIIPAMGLDATRQESALRFSLSSDNTAEEVDYCLKVVEDLLPVLRRYSRR